MAIERGLKFGLHPLDIRFRQRCAATFRRYKSVNPFVVKRIELQGVFGRIQVATQIVARVARQPRDHACSRAARRANH